MARDRLTHNEVSGSATNGPPGRRAAALLTPLSNPPRGQIPVSRWKRAAVATVCILVWLGACERHRTPQTLPAEPAPTDTPEVATSPRPTYSIEPSLRRAFPHVTTFVEAFLQTCLAGDYEGYRSFVSRYAEPESPDRFNAIYNAIRSVRVVAIDPLPHGGPQRQQAWRVVTHVKFDPASAIHLRRRNNRFALLVFREQQRWRMMPAPSHLQPRTRPASRPSTTTTATRPVPDYPWDEDVDS